MPTIPIETYGLGRYTKRPASKIPQGAARASLNLLHSEPTEAKRRAAINRTHAARAANGVMLGAHELFLADGTNHILEKIGTDLYVFADIAAATTTGGSILSSMSASFIAQFATASGSVFIADSAKNYISRGTSGTTYELQKAAPTGVITLASAGTATGNAAGSVRYSYTDVTPEGVESPPYTVVAGSTVSRSADAGVTVTNSSLSFTAPYTTKNLYRTKADGSQMYRVTTGLTAPSFPYADTSLDTSLTTISAVHGDNVVTASIEKPAGAKHVGFHRQRLFLASGSFIQWSLPGEPTQFSNATSARNYLGKLDGTDITGIVSFRGSMVVFKERSIWTLNGDTDDAGFVWSESVTGTGCIAPRSLVVDGDRAIYFLSACGVYSYDLSRLTPVSENILPDFDDLETDRYALFCAGIEPCTHRYLLAVTPNGGSANTVVHALNLDNAAGAWGLDRYSMGTVKPSCFALMENTDGAQKLFVGDTNGYLYETDCTNGADGVTSGDHSGIVTAYLANVTTCGAAALRTAGDTLKGLALTLYRAADSSYESVEITSNTATAVTHAAFSGTNPVAGDTVFVGAFQYTLHLDQMNLDTGRRKRFGRIELTFEKQTHAIALRLGYTLDAGSAPTGTTAYVQNLGYVARKRIDRRGFAVSVYIDAIGVDHAFDMLGLTVDAEVLNARLPTQ